MANEIIKSLHPLEIKVLIAIKKVFSNKETLSVENIQKESGLQQIEVMRALQWLSNKNLIDLNYTRKKLIFLDKNGTLAKKQGLPEKKVLLLLKKKKQASLDELKKDLGDIIGFSIGALKSKAAIITEKKGNQLIIKIASNGEKLLDKESLEEKFLHKRFPLDQESITPEEQFAINSLKGRKAFLKFETKNIPIILLTDKFKKITITKLPKQEYLEKLTPELLKTGQWKNKKFRPYDIHAEVPYLDIGKKHFVNESINNIKKIWLELGFEEMTGTKTQSAFWDLDALFVPQDHPAREMQDTFYLDVEPAKLPKILTEVKTMHEKGDSDSKGWRYNFSEKIASQVLLRTHTTVLSARHIQALKKEDLPKKFFKIGKVYRNESMDWKHLFELHQVEGIVVDKDANFQHLLGYLKQFYEKLGHNKIRMRPGHFPYTEPSVEVEYFNQKKEKWVELGGAGMLRPEVTKMLFGEEIPVLAWGQGMERSISSYYEITDIRELYYNDFKQLKSIKSHIN